MSTVPFICVLVSVDTTKNLNMKTVSSCISKGICRDVRGRDVREHGLELISEHSVASPAKVPTIVDFQFVRLRLRFLFIELALKKFCIGVFFMGLLALYGSFADLPVILGLDEPLSVKWGRILLALFLTRGKYYATWKLAEGATIIFGAGFEGFDEQGSSKGWNGVSNIDILGFEFR